MSQSTGSMSVSIISEVIGLFITLLFLLPLLMARAILEEKALIQ